MVAIATPSFSFTVVQSKICEHCGKSFLRSADSPSPYCPACVAFFTALDALSAARENQPAEKPRKKTGPKPGSVRNVRLAAR